MTLFTIFAAKYLIYVIALAAAAVIFYHKEYRLELAILALLSLAFGYALARLAGLFYFHYQPFAELGFDPLVPHAIDNAFPSDHTLIAGVFSTVAFLADRRAGLVLSALTLLVGTGRVAAGLHWPVDILASCALALVAVIAAHYALTVVMKGRFRQVSAQDQ